MNNEINYKKKYLSLVKEIEDIIKLNVDFFNSYSDYFTEQPENWICLLGINKFDQESTHLHSSLVGCYYELQTLTNLYSSIIGKECDVYLNDRGCIEVIIKVYSDDTSKRNILFGGRMYNNVMYNKGYTIKTHGADSLEDLKKELASMGIAQSIVSYRDASYTIFKSGKYLDIGYEYLDIGYGYGYAFMTYIVAENGLKLNLDKCWSYDDKSNVENELMTFIDLALN